MYSPGIGIGIIPRMSVTSVSVVTATVATGIGITSFTANWNAFSGAQYYLLDVSTSSSFSTFVYQDQVILAPTTAYVVIGLTENTTYYYRVRASTDVYIDPDYLAFFNRVIAAGGFLTIAEQDSTKQLVADLKANSLWTPMKAIYPMVGASAAACAQNLKSSSFTGTFTSGWTFSSTGATPNGTSAYMDTGFAPSSNLTLSNASIGYYGGTSGITDRCALGAGGGSSYFEIYPAFPAYGLFGDIFDPSIVNTFHTNAAGFIFAYRNSSSIEKKHSIRGVISTLSSATNSSTISSNVVLGARKIGASFDSYSNLQHRFSFMGDGLTDAQASNFYTAVQAFNQSLNRQVGAQLVSDSDAQAYINRVYTAGGTLTNTEATAVNQLTIDLKSNGTWSSMKAIYPMIGASAAACAQNLRSSSFTGTFTASGWTFASSGVTPNGSSAYMDTGLIPSTSLSLNNASLGYYGGTTGVASGAVMGVGPTTGNFQVFPANFGLGLFGDVNDGSGTYTNNTNAAGFIFAYRTSSSQKKHSIRGTITTKNENSNNIPTNSVFIGARNNAGSGNAFTNQEHRFNFIGDGLTDTQASDFYTSVQTFNQTLDRQVGAQIVSDPDAQSYINRVYTAGGTLTNLEANAVNKLAIDMKAAGLWTSMKAVYPMIGSSAASCAQNLKSSSFTGTFTSNWVFSATGATPNGTSDYMDTNCLSNNVFTQGNAGFAVYRRTVNVQNGNSKVDFGAAAVGLALPIVYFKGRSGNGAFESGMWSYNYSQGAFANTTNSQTIGFYQVHRTSTTLATGYNGGTSWITSTNSNTAYTPNIPRNMFLAAVNDANAGGGVDFNDCQYAFASISDGLNSTQASNFYTAVQSFNQTLGRSVGSQIVSDADAQAYVNRVYNAGGSLTNTEANAVNQLVLDMKTAGIWTSMKAVYPMVGSSAAACAQNLKSSSFTGTFTAGWTFASTGATPDGTSAYFDTNLVPSTSLLLDSVSLSFYSRTNTQGNIQMGVNDTSNYLIQQMYSSTQMYSQLNGVGGSFIDAPVTQFQGLFTTSRTSNIAVAAYKNGTNIKNDVKSSSSRPVLNFYIGARNNNNSAGNFDNKQCAFAHIGDGLTDVQATALYNATQIFQNTLGRAI